MKRHFYSLLMLLTMGLASCNIIIKPDPNSVTTNVDSVEVTVNMKVYGDSIASQPVDLTQCDMLMLDKGKLSFYNSTTAVMTPFEAEKDSVVNCVFTGDNKVYYCVACKPKILLRCVDLEQANPQPQELADWGVPYEKCVTETYGTVSPLEYYRGKNTLGLNHNFSWDGYWFTDKKLYNIETGEITDWTWKWEEEYQRMQNRNDEEQTEENYHYISTANELQEYLTVSEGQYYMTDGNGDNIACLTDRIDFSKYVSDPEYASDVEFEYVSSSPDNLKVLYMAILEWGDFPHGILAISSTDGKLQIPLEDTDCTGYTAEWLDDGSLVYVGEEPLTPDDPDYDANWHYRAHCIKRVYPDGHTEIIAPCGEFVMKQPLVN